MEGRRILMGVVGRPHGVRGLMHVQSYTADPRDLSGYGPLLDDRGGRWTLVWRMDGVAELRDAEGKAVADRSAAERLTNMRLYVERERLPAAGEDEFYLSDLVGLRAEDPAGAELGRVLTVHDYGAGTSLEIARPGSSSQASSSQGQPLLVPFTRACVPEVDVGAGRVVVVVPDEIVVQP